MSKTRTKDIAEEPVHDWLHTTKATSTKTMSECEAVPLQKPPAPPNTSKGAQKLRSWLNKTLRIKMTDGRVLIGVFLCTDRDANIILGTCSEYLPPDLSGTSNPEEPRILGLVMVPGKHIVSVHLDKNSDWNSALAKDVDSDDVM